VKFIVRCPDGKIRNYAYGNKAAAEERAAELDEACLYEMPFSGEMEQPSASYMTLVNGRYLTWKIPRSTIRCTPPSACWRGGKHVVEKEKPNG